MKLERADNLIESNPDSSLFILKSILKDELKTDKEKARYGLLMSMALDKNYIDLTTFDILQPAIDYYLKNGTPDEKLRTYYYEGIIFLNQGNRDRALNSFLKGLDIKNSTDSLILSRLFVAQGQLYADFFDFENYIRSNLKAGEIYKALSRPNQEIDCYLKALNGAIVLDNKTLSDSIIDNINGFHEIDEFHQSMLNRYQLSYTLNFGDKNKIRELICDEQAHISSTKDMLTLALAFNKIGNNEKAKYFLDCVKNGNVPYDTIRYLSILVSVLKDLEDYRTALSVYETFSHKQDSINLLKSKQNIKTIEEKHQFELQFLNKHHTEERLIWWFVGGIIILLLSILILLLIIRNNRNQKKNILIEKRQKDLENENLRLEKIQLENERDNLKELLKNQSELASPIQEIIKQRLNILNGLLAKEITNIDAYAKTYDKLIESIHKNKKEFMNSNRLAIAASYPNFIKYLEKQDLTVDEINYVCLYAIGLRGKEIGEYIQLKRHYNISSDIRKKLGMEETKINIGPYIRKLMIELS